MADDPPFVPAVLEAMVPAAAVGHERKTARRKAKPDGNRPVRLSITHKCLIHLREARSKNLESDESLVIHC